MDFLIATSDLHRCRFEDGEPPAPGDGEALLAVDRFGLSANNITYAKFGEAMSYWSFFPAPEGWGRMPVWGFATVAESRVEALPEGARIYGYLPPSSELLVRPARAGAQGFVDASAHRAALPAAYNSYQRTDGDPYYDAAREDQQMLLRPLFFTSWLIDDFLRDSELFGAGTVVLSSASSKTASGLAFLLSREGDAEVLGLTSAGAADFTRSLGVYDEVLRYDEPRTCRRGARSTSTCRATPRCERRCTRTSAASSPIRRWSARPITIAWTPCLTSCPGRGRRSSSPRTGSPSAAPSGAARASNGGSRRPGRRTSSGPTAGCG